MNVQNKDGTCKYLYSAVKRKINQIEEIEEKHKELLKELKDGRVLGLDHGVEDYRVGYKSKKNGKLYLVEWCDEYFSVELTKEKCEQLAKLFKELGEVL